MKVCHWTVVLLVGAWAGLSTTANAELFRRRFSSDHSSTTRNYSSTTRYDYDDTDGNRIRMNLYPQSTNTCWAAVSRSIVAHLKGEDHSIYDLCEKFTGGYDKGWHTDKVLAHYEVYEGFRSSATFEEIKKEIDAGDPVAINVTRPGKEPGHVMLIYGYTSSGKYRLYDPDRNGSYLVSEQQAIDMVSNGVQADYFFTKGGTENKPKSPTTPKEEVTPKIVARTPREADPDEDPIGTRYYDHNRNPITKAEYDRQKKAYDDWFKNPSNTTRTTTRTTYEWPDGTWRSTPYRGPGYYYP